MLSLTSTQTASLQHCFLPERPGALVGPHVLETGSGACWADRWPAPQAVLVKISVNHTLVGDVHAVTSTDLQPHINGYVETSETFLPLLRATFADVHLTPRIVLAQPGAASQVQSLDYPMRRLVAADTSHLEGLDPELAWICKSWGGPYGLARSGCSWGIFVDNRLAAVACTFFLGKSYEDIGILTVPKFRGLGLSTACANALCNDIRARGHQPSWVTSPDNPASLRVAEKLGFTVQRTDFEHVVRGEIRADAHDQSSHS